MKINEPSMTDILRRQDERAERDRRAASEFYKSHKRTNFWCAIIVAICMGAVGLMLALAISGCEPPPDPNAEVVSELQALRREMVSLRDTVEPISDVSRTLQASMAQRRAAERGRAAIK